MISENYHILNIQTKVRDIFANQLDLPFASQLDAKEKLNALGVASVDVIRLLSLLEKDLEILINDDQYAQCDSIENISRVCAEILQNRE